MGGHLSLSLSLFLSLSPSHNTTHTHTCKRTQEVGKRDALLEERLRAQDVDYRRQCEELRMRVQHLLKERDRSMREKVRVV